MSFDWIATHPWAYPALEVVHLLGVAALVGGLLVFDLRLWGLGRSLPLKALARLVLPLAAAGFVVAAGSGLLLLASQWRELLGNAAFQIKMGLVLAAGANAAVFHRRQGAERHDGWASAQTVLSVGLWAAVVTCGRFIAYV